MFNNSLKKVFFFAEWANISEPLSILPLSHSLEMGRAQMRTQDVYKPRAFPLSNISHCLCSLTIKKAFIGFFLIMKKIRFYLGYYQKYRQLKKGTNDLTLIDSAYGLLHPIATSNIHIYVHTCTNAHTFYVTEITLDGYISCTNFLTFALYHIA